MTHRIIAVATNVLRSASFCKTAFVLLIACATVNILCECAFSLDSAGRVLTPENINKQRYKFVVEIGTGDPSKIRLNRYMQVGVGVESRAPGFKKTGVKAMLHLGRLGAIRDGESQLGYFALKPEIVGERVVFYMFVVPESLERMGIILDCGRDKDDRKEAGAYQVFPRDFLSKNQILEIKKLKDARREKAMKEASQKTK